MWLRLAACAAFLVVPVAYAQTGTAPSSTLSLDDAIARVATTHPDLRIFDGRRRAQHARAFAIEAFAQVERNRALILDDEDPPAVQHIFGIHQRAP